MAYLRKRFITKVQLISQWELLTGNKAGHREWTMLNQELEAEINILIKQKGGKTMPETKIKVGDYVMFNNQFAHSKKVYKVKAIFNDHVAALEEIHDKSYAQAVLGSLKKLTPGVCRICGCTDDYACHGGCYWVDDTKTLCSQCSHEKEEE